MQDRTKSLHLITTPESVEIGVAGQKVRFEKFNGWFAARTLVRQGSDWRYLFDARRPLIEGPLFDLRPEAYTVLENGLDRKVVEFRGKLRPSGVWTVRVRVERVSPLVQFTMTCELPEPLTLDSPQPVVALWMKRQPAFHLDQGPDSIYGSTGIPHGYGFPAAYLWDAGAEAAVFFDMGAMHWMQRDGVARFHDVRIMARSDPEATGLGMHVKKLSGGRIPAGRMTISFYLFQNARMNVPTGLEALDVMVRTFAPLHPTISGMPKDQQTGKPASWNDFAGRAIQGLTATPRLMGRIPAPAGDTPLNLVPASDSMLVHAGSIGKEESPSSLPWDFSTVNNHLTPWLLLSRAKGARDMLQLGLQKANSLPRFYDPRSRLIRHGTRQPPHVGDLEMTWQNLFFHIESVRAASAMPVTMFNPCIAGRFLMATQGLRELGRASGYVFPQWFDPYTKQPVVQNDVKALGLVREPWQVGSYAYLMLQAYEITGESTFADEAKRSVETLMERMRFQVRNEVYDRTYTDTATFPVTELFGNAYGIAAAYRLYRMRGKAKFLRYSRDFLNTLLRLTFWYEDDSDAVCRELRNAGLFYPHGGAHVATPWETAEAHLLIAWTLKHDTSHPLTKLLLTLSNLNRMNAFYFFPAAWPVPVRARAGITKETPGQYFPIEPFYCLEGDGHQGTTAAYMAGLALWNAWLYEALAETDDPAVMALNLDALEDSEASLSGTARNIIVFNSSSRRRLTRVRFNALPDAQYVVTFNRQAIKRSADELRQGLPLPLEPGAYRRLQLRALDYTERMRRHQEQSKAQNALASAYRALQERATETSVDHVTAGERSDFAHALSACREGRPDDAMNRIRKLRK